jgi:hypothetical protein
MQNNKKQMKKIYLKNGSAINRSKESVRLFAKCSCGKGEIMIMHLHPGVGISGWTVVKMDCCQRVE